MLLQYEFTWEVFARFPHGAQQCQVLSKQELGQRVRREEIVSGNVTGGTVNQSCQITYNPCSLLLFWRLTFLSNVYLQVAQELELTSHIDQMLRPYRSGFDGM